MWTMYVAEDCSRCVKYNTRVCLGLPPVQYMVYGCNQKEPYRPRSVNPEVVKSDEERKRSK